MVSGVFQIRAFRPGEDIKIWMERLENFILAEYGEEINGVRKKAILQTAIGEDAELAIINFAVAEKDTFQHLKTKLLEYYEPQLNDFVQRHTFYNLFQEENEKLDDFVNRLKAQAAKCNFKITCTPATAGAPAVEHDITEEFIRDRLVVGLYDNSTKRRLMRERTLTLTTAIDLVRATEIANKQIRQITQPSAAKQIHANQRQQKGPQMQRRPQHPQTNPDSSMSNRKQFQPQKAQNERPLYCKYCGDHHQRGANFCRAYKKKCRKCGKMNHTEKVCYLNKRRELHAVNEQQNYDFNDYDAGEYQAEYEDYEQHDEYRYSAQNEPHDNNYAQSSHEYNYEVNNIARAQNNYEDECGNEFEQLEIGLLTLHYPSSNKNEVEINSVVKDWFETILVNDTPHTIKIDTGAQANVIALKTVTKILPKAEIVPTRVTLSAYGGSNIPVIGKISVNCCPIDNTSWCEKTEFIVVNTKVRTVLGLETCIKLQFVRPKNEKIILSKSNSGSERQAHGFSKQKLTVPVQNNKFRYQEEKNPTYFREMTSRRNDMTKHDTQQQINKQQSNKTVVTNPALTAIVTEYSDIFDNSTVGCIKGYEYDIKLKTGSIPVISKRKPVPFATEHNIELELDRMLNLKVIDYIEGPTEWLNTTVTVQKGDKTRICLDPYALNKCILRERTHLPTTDEVFSKIRGAKYFTKLDLKDGYWQIQLTQEASMLTAFQTHRGPMRFTRLPFGLKSANEIFQKKVSQVYNKCEGVLVIYDDVLIYGSTEEEHNNRLKAVLQRSRNAGIRLNRAKCKFMLKEVKYVGHIISSEGIKVDPEKVEDIQNMPAPEDKKGVQRILGTLNFLSRYIPNMSSLTHSIRQLLVKNIPFMWTKTHEDAFNKIKQILTNAPVLGYYDVNKPIILEADASGHGLGAVILQNGKPVAYASRSLTNPQINYAQIEKELLSIVFGCERFRQYLYAKEVEVHTDHKPLITTLEKPLQDNPKRIQRLLLRLQCYDLTLRYVPGKDLHIPDMLSRAHAAVNTQTESERKLTQEADYQIHVVIKNLKCSNQMRDKIRNESNNDLELKQVEQYIVLGWPKCLSDTNDLAKLYWPHRAELASYDGYIIFRDRIVIPRALRADLLNKVHVGHQGRERCKRLARTAIFWPSMNKEIDLMVDRCEPCLTRRNNPARETLKPHTVPKRAWQKIGTDLFTYGGKRFQIVIDYFSKWVEIKRVPLHATSADVVEHFRSIFSRFGYPEEIFSDGDPLYTSNEFNKYCKSFEIDHSFSSSRYPQSNGQVERAVQHFKNILAKSIYDDSDFYKALLAYRNTPLSSNISSPAVLLFNRSLRTNLPCLKLENYSDKVNRKLLESRQLKGKQYYDSKIKAKNRPHFENSNLIKYRDSLADKIWKSGQILSHKTPNRSYNLVNSRGNIITRNNRLIIPDTVNRQLEVEYDCIPGDYVQNMNTAPPPVQPPAHAQGPEQIPHAFTSTAASALPAPPIRRSSRISRKPSFYGKPVLY